MTNTAMNDCLHLVCPLQSMGPQSWTRLSDCTERNWTELSVSYLLVESSGSEKFCKASCIAEDVIFPDRVAAIFLLNPVQFWESVPVSSLVLSRCSLKYCRYLILFCKPSDSDTQPHKTTYHTRQCPFLSVLLIAFFTMCLQYLHNAFLAHL